jgi:hypothetical protein
MLHSMMLEAMRRGEESLEISAGELRGRFDGHLGAGDRIPDCCQAMRDAFAPDAGDAVVEEPPRRQPARLRIRFVLPHPSLQGDR